MNSSFPLLVKCLESDIEPLANRCDSASNLRPRSEKTANATVSIIIVACLALCFMLSAFTSMEPLHYRLASDPALKGKAKDGECMDYAIALSSRLAANGIHGQLVFYRWHLRDTHQEGSHVFVMYHLPDKTEWIVDNELLNPKAVPPEASLLQLVFLLSNAPSAPVEVELQDGLNHLSYF
jgi:hypothetical protein